MLLIIHQDAKQLLSVRYNEQELIVEGTSICAVFWELGKKFPEETIIWCEKEVEKYLNTKSWPEIFHHDLIMASFAVKSKFLPASIGYIDQLPFVNVSRKILFPTWQMSSDIGGIKGKTLLKFRDLTGNLKDFNFLLNSIGRLGQQNGLFCYSAPQLANKGITFDSVPEKASQTANIKVTASKRKLFSFVYAHYKTVRLLILFWCYVKYERSFPIGAFFRALLQKKYFKKQIDLAVIPVQTSKQERTANTIDVIIPTMGRRDHLLQVLEDLKVQSFRPAKVIVAEQNPEPGSQTDLPELNFSDWPFEIVHHFTHQAGACKARNIALEEISGDWIFFADDDIRLNSNLLEKSLSEAERLGADCLNINCKQEGEETVFHKIKQWGSFGSGTSIVKAKYCNRTRFDEVFEYGFGEDQDYGMQLRNSGCDIIYHPELQILHLKATLGGFREVKTNPWTNDNPKPSPTLMVYAIKHYSREQIKGYKTELFLRYYSQQEIKNPIKYLNMMRERWVKSEEWAIRLISGKDRKHIETKKGYEI